MRIYKSQSTIGDSEVRDRVTLDLRDFRRVDVGFIISRQPVLLSMGINARAWQATELRTTSQQ